jgi:mannose-6-phosphate isomerase
MSAKIDKPWGWEEIIEHNDKYVVKKLFMKEGHQCSLQYHKFKTETIVVLEGKLKIKIDEDIHNECNAVFNPYEEITIVPLVTHRMYGETDCLYLECSTPELDDVVRVKDDYGRTDE